MAPGRLALPLLLASAAAGGAAAAEALLSAPAAGAGAGAPTRQLSNVTDLTKAWKVYNVRSSSWGNSVGRHAYFDDSARPGFKFEGSKKVVMVEQYRGGAKIWSGGVLLWKSTSDMRGSCSPGKCTGMARRAANHGDDQWKYGDLIWVQTWEAAKAKKSDEEGGEADEVMKVVIILVIIVALVAGVCCLGAAGYFLYKTMANRPASARQLKDAGGEDAPAQRKANDVEDPSQEDLPEPPKPRKLIEDNYPSRWCVTPEQFFALVQQVHLRFPDRDPSVQEVVDAIVKPATEAAGTSYALYFNREGVPCRHFVTHAWQAGVKQLGMSVRDADPTGGIWIDFLAIPQTLPKEEMDEILGEDMWKSPCAKAITMCSDVIHVRNPACHLLSRLWCVFELFLAYELEKPVTVVGCEGDVPEAPMGLSATCTNESDLVALRAALDPRKESVNEWLDGTGMVVAADL